MDRTDDLRDAILYQTSQTRREFLATHADTVDATRIKFAADPTKANLQDLVAAWTRADRFLRYSTEDVA